MKKVKRKKQKLTWEKRVAKDLRRYRLKEDQTKSRKSCRLDPTLERKREKKKSEKMMMIDDEFLFILVFNKIKFHLFVFVY